MKVEMKFGYMNGSPGCLPDHNTGYCYDSEEEAREAAAGVLELTEEESAQLAELSPLYIHGERCQEVGAGLVEIISSNDSDEIAESVEEY